MRNFKKVGILLLVLSLFSTVFPAIAQEKESPEEQKVKWVNPSKEAKSKNRIDSDLESVAKKVKERETLKTDGDTFQTVSSSTALSGPDVKSKINDAPYKVPSAQGQISTMTGGLTIQEADFILPGRNGLSFALTRTYDSNAARLYGMGSGRMYNSDGTSYMINTLQETYENKIYPIGAGWSFDIPSIEIDEVGNKYLKYEGGSYFVTESPDGYQPHGYHLKDLIFYVDKSVTVHNQTSSYMLLSVLDGRKYYFSDRGRLIQISDRYGNTIKFHYSSSDYDNAFVLSRIIDAVGNQITITYSPEQVVITNGSKQVTYYKTTLSGGRELLSEVIDQAGRRTVYSYWVRNAYFNIADDSPVNNPIALLTSVQHPTGSKSAYSYENVAYKRKVSCQTRLYTEVYRMSSAEVQMFLENGLVISKDRTSVSYTGDIGSCSPFSTSLNDGLTQSVYDFVSVPTLQNTTERILRLSKETTNQGDQKWVTSYTYDANRFLTIPDVTTTQFVTPTGSSEAIINSRIYDDYGNVLSEQHASGSSATYTYDPMTHLLAKVTQSVSGSQTQYTEFQRNAQGSITQSVTKDQTGQVLKQSNFLYDAYGNVVTETLKNGVQETVVNNQYDVAYLSAFLTKQSLQVTDATGVSSVLEQRYSYDSTTGAITRAVNKNGKATDYQYDTLGRLTYVAYPDLSTYHIVYDDLANTIVRVDETGLKTVHKWNPLGEKTEEGIWQDGVYQVKLTNGYDEFGRQVWSADALGRRSQLAYDAWGRNTSTTSPSGGTTLIQYNDVTREKMVTDPDGNQVKELMDKVGRVVQKQFNPGTGQMETETYTYDYAGNMTSLKDAKNNVIQYQYDALGRLVSVTDPQNKKTGYVYDMLDQLTTINYADGSSSLKKYDEAGRIIQKTDQLGRVETFFYDGNGNLTSKVDRNKQTTGFTYDSRDRLLTKTSGLNHVGYTYDPAGKRLQMIDGTGTTSYSYFADGSLKNVTYPDGKTISYAYYANGQRSMMNDPFGKDIYYRYDEGNRLTGISLNSLTDPSEITYAYTPGDRVQQSQLRNGMISGFVYEGSSLKSLQHKTMQGVVQNNFGYMYDPNGNQVQKTENSAAYDFTYDPLNRIETSSQFHDVYSYDDRGNRLTLKSEHFPSMMDSTYDYDVWNQLVKVTQADGTTVSYTYNGDGLLYERTDGVSTTRYYYDGDQMIAEADVSGGIATLKARYLRSGSKLIAREDAAGNKAYYLHNGHGDVVELRDGSGNVLNSYSYDIWGNPLTVSETVENPFRYSGEYWDDATGLQYLRARWYDPGLGRFVNEDSFEGSIENPLGLNIYTYVQNNPLKFIDPSGHIAQQLDPELPGKLDPIYLQDPEFVDRLLKAIQKAESNHVQVKGMAKLLGTAAEYMERRITSDVIWSEYSPTDRGNIIEFILSTDEYEDWYYIGREYNGFFPVIDFQLGEFVVSLKTIDPRGYSSSSLTSKISSYADQLVDRKIYRNGEFVPVSNRYLDIRVPYGTVDLIDLDQFVILYPGLNITVEEF